MTFTKIGGYIPVCVKCSKDVSIEELDSINADSNVGPISFYIHKACLAKTQAKKSKGKKSNG